MLICEALGGGGGGKRGQGVSNEDQMILSTCHVSSIRTLLLSLPVPYAVSFVKVVVTQMSPPPLRLADSRMFLQCLRVLIQGEVREAAYLLLSCEG